MDKEDGVRAEVDELLKHLLDELGDLENQLMANEIALQESSLDADIQASYQKSRPQLNPSSHFVSDLPFHVILLVG